MVGAAMTMKLIQPSLSRVGAKTGNMPHARLLCKPRGMHGVVAAETDRVSQCGHDVRSRATRNQRSANSSCCGKSSVISYQSAFEPTKMCSDGRMRGSSTSVPMVTWT